MKYEFIRWKDGDELNYNRLNAMENAIANFNSNTIIISGAIDESDNYTLPMSFTDIKAAFLAGKNIIIDATSYYNTYYGKIVCVRHNDFFCFFGSDTLKRFSINDSGYPYIVEEE